MGWKAACLELSKSAGLSGDPSAGGKYIYSAEPDHPDPQSAKTSVWGFVKITEELRLNEEGEAGLYTHTHTVLCVYPSLRDELGDRTERTECPGVKIETAVCRQVLPGEPVWRTTELKVNSLSPGCNGGNIVPSCHTVQDRQIGRAHV